MRLEHLLIVAGPRAAGKSYLLKRLKRKSANQLRATLRLGAAARRQVNARQFDADAPRPFTVLPSQYISLHYEITRTWRRPYGHESDPGLALLGIAERRTFLTLWAPPKVLLLRMVRRDFTGWRRQLLCLISRPCRRFPSGKDERRRAFADLYGDGSSELERIYRDWFRYCSGYPADDHWVADTSSSVSRVMRIDPALPAADPPGADQLQPVYGAA